jgi:hypothetical protein
MKTSKPLRATASLAVCAMALLSFVCARTGTVSATSHAGNVAAGQTTSEGAPFTLITEGVLVTDPGYNCGSTWADFDNDGFPDLFVHHEGPDTADYIYRNNGDGTFTRLSTPIPQGLTGKIAAWGNAWGDYDNDGHLDLFIANAYSGGNLLLRNRGDGTFERIRNAPSASTGGIWGDFNRDGYLDLLAIDSHIASSPANNALYRNEGNGTFVKMGASQMGRIVSDTSTWLMASWVDANDDGWLDLFAVSTERSTLYSNLAHGGFGVATSALSSSSFLGAAFAWADYDNDGRLDLAVGGELTTTLFHQEPDGTFKKMSTAQTGIPQSHRSRFWGGMTWGDYDNDGFLDLLVSGGSFDSTPQPTVSRNFLYHNNGDGSFTPITTGSLVQNTSDWMHIDWVDYDRDGFLDVYIQPHGVTPLYAPNVLYHNDGNENNWLGVSCVGTSSPRDGTGAKVRALARIRGKEMSQLRLINAGGTCWGGRSFVAHFGLGDATNVDVLRIEWSSGRVQELYNIPAGQYITVTEPASLSMPRAGELVIKCWKGMAWQVETSSDLSAWTPLATVTNENLTGAIQWTDPSVRRPDACFYRVTKR